VFGGNRALGERAPGAEVDCSRGIEIAVLGEVGSLGNVDAVDRLWNEEVKVGVALPMPVAGQVDRRSVDEERHVGAVIRVEAAQEQLVRLAATLVLRDHQAGYDPEDVFGRCSRAKHQVSIANGLRRCGGGGRRCFHPGLQDVVVLAGGPRRAVGLCNSLLCFGLMLWIGLSLGSQGRGENQQGDCWKRMKHELLQKLRRAVIRSPAAWAERTARGDEWWKKEKSSVPGSAGHLAGSGHCRSRLRQTGIVLFEPRVLWTLRHCWRANSSAFRDL